VVWAQIAAAVALVALAWTWLLLPELRGVGEILAVAAPAWLVGVIALHVVAFVARRRVLVAVSCLAWVVSATVMVVSPRTPTHFAPPRDPVVIVAANLRLRNHTPRQAAREVVARGADVVVISEATNGTEAVLTDAYPYHFGYGWRGDIYYSELVASRYPLRARPVPSNLRQGVVVEVMAPTPFLLVGIHLPRAGIALPYLRGQLSFAAQKRAVDTLTRLTDSSNLPVVVAGDMNVSDRSAAYRRLVAHRRDAMRASWARSTFREFPWSLFALRIDHVFIDASWCADHASRFHPVGTDHDAVQVTIGPCP
jgi:endonuclease/exonuclease/phosphatase (EEP) superfamily protein YafD